MKEKWFEVKVGYDKTLETGTVKKVVDTYLVDAMSFAEAEARATEQMMPFISGEFEVEAAKKCNIAEICANPDCDKWYRCKVMFITLDEKSGVEKKTASIIMVQANDITKALECLEDMLKSTMSDWEIHTIAESQILDVFVYG